MMTAVRAKKEPQPTSLMNKFILPPQRACYRDFTDRRVEQQCRYSPDSFKQHLNTGYFVCKGKYAPFLVKVSQFIGGVN